jgi:DNA-binding GntR family transcriptional regulator
MLAGDLETWPARALQEHEGIIEAITSGDAELARRRSEQHVLQVRERLLRKPSGEPAGAPSRPVEAARIETKVGEPG